MTTRKPFVPSFMRSYTEYYGIHSADDAEALSKALADEAGPGEFTGEKHQALGMAALLYHDDATAAEALFLRAWGIEMARAGELSASRASCYVSSLATLYLSQGRTELALAAWARLVDEVERRDSIPRLEREQVFSYAATMLCLSDCKADAIPYFERFLALRRQGRMRSWHHVHELRMYADALRHVGNAEKAQEMDALADLIESRRARSKLRAPREELPKPESTHAT